MFPTVAVFPVKKIVMRRRREKATASLHAVGAKLARANYYMLRDGVPYDPQRLFGKAKTQKRKRENGLIKAVAVNQERGLVDKPTV